MNLDTFRYGRDPSHPKRRARVNWWIFFMGQLFWLLETAHFGFNALPGSDAEVICDGIAILITALAFL